MINILKVALQSSRGTKLGWEGVAVKGSGRLLTIVSIKKFYMKRRWKKKREMRRRSKRHYKRDEKEGKEREIKKDQKRMAMTCNSESRDKLIDKTI